MVEDDIFKYLGKIRGKESCVVINDNILMIELVFDKKEF